MTDWQPIETAPADVPVRLGGWENAYSHEGPPLRWATRVHAAWHTKNFFLFKLVVRDEYTREYTHWQPLPPPPPVEVKQ
jgi:hypothetical protein